MAARDTDHALKKLAAKVVKGGRFTTSADEVVVGMTIIYAGKKIKIESAEAKGKSIIRVYSNTVVDNATP